MSDGPRLGRWALSTRFLAYFSVAYTILIGLMSVGIMASVQSGMEEVLVDRFVVDARLGVRSLPPDRFEMSEWARSVSVETGARVTVIEESGVVIADSHSDPAAMENHANRPEVIAALAGEVGRSSRRSDTTGFEQHYVALPAANGLILRMSLPDFSIQNEIDKVKTVIIGTGIVVGLLGIAIVAILARRLAKPIGDLTGKTIAIADGDRSVRPGRSSIRELDNLGRAISRLVDQLAIRLDDAEQATATMEVVLGALPQGTVLIGADSSIIYANPAAYQLLGQVPADAGRLIPYPLQTAVREAREQRKQVAREVEHGKPTRLLRGFATPFLDDDRVLLIVADVTERERMATVRRDFVANASHELKTPVSSIIASADALKIAIAKDPESANRFAGQIEDSALQLDRMVSDLLDLSRLERESPDLAPMSLDRLAIEEVERIRVSAESAGIVIVADLQPVSVMGSRRDLSIAMRNLLENAIRYTSSGGTISLSISELDGEVVVSVVDTGEGIPTRDHERVFERFYRVDSARSRASGGTGLGLSIVKHVIEGHGGSVELESELGVGSTFTIRMPRQTA